MSENKINLDLEFQLFPIGEWLPGKEINELKSINDSVNPSYEEFQYSKEFTVDEAVVNSSNDVEDDLTPSESEDTDVTNVAGSSNDSEKTLVINTRKFQNFDETKVINIHDNEKILEEENTNDLAEEEVEEEVLPAISTEEKTSVINLSDIKEEVLNDGSLAESEFEKELEKEEASAVIQQKELEDKSKIKSEEESSEESGKNKTKKEKKRIGVLGILSILVVGYFYMDEEPTDVKLVPQYYNFVYPTPAETLNEIRSKKNLREGLALIPKIESGLASREEVRKAMKHFLISLESQFRVTKTKDDQTTYDINESVDYLIYLYSLKLEDTKKPIKAGETLYSLVKLVQSRVFTSSYVAIGVANYYMSFEKYNAAKATIENYLRISKKPTLEIFIKYLQIAIADGDFKLSRDLFNKIKDVPNLSIEGVLTVVSFLELDGRNDEAFEILKIPQVTIELVQKFY